jgi:hypothetical protein
MDNTLKEMNTFKNNLEGLEYCSVVKHFPNVQEAVDLDHSITKENSLEKLRKR